MTRELDGKTALVTGARCGLGVHMALRLARAGPLVAVSYASDEAAANETVRRIEAEGGQAFTVWAKLGDEAAARALVDALDRELTGSHGLDILVNNIGGGDYGPIAAADEAMYDRMFSNNVKADAGAVRSPQRSWPHHQHIPGRHAADRSQHHRLHEGEDGG